MLGAIWKRFTRGEMFDGSTTYGPIISREGNALS
jgi:hypothetical protein